MLKRSFGTVRIFSLDRAAIREALRRHIDTRYRPDPNIVAVYLFGSFARGRPSRAATSICSSSSARSTAAARPDSRPSAGGVPSAST